MSLWWLQPGWADATCASCGATIAPEGDPDWGYCWPCMQHRTEQHRDRSGCQYCDGYCHGGCREGGY